MLSLNFFLPKPSQTYVVFTLGVVYLDTLGSADIDERPAH